MFSLDDSSLESDLQRIPVESIAYGQSLCCLARLALFELAKKKLPENIYPVHEAFRLDESLRKLKTFSYGIQTVLWHISARGGKDFCLACRYDYSGHSTILKRGAKELGLII